MSFSHPRDVAQAMYKAAMGALPTGGAYLIKSFDSNAEELARGIVAAAGSRAEVKRQGFLSSSELPKYTAEQIRGSIRIEEQPQWKELGYAPQFSLKSTCEEIAAWYAKEPWVVESA